MSRGREVLVGVVLIAAVAVAVTGTLWLQDVGWGGDRVEIQARFRDAGQLMEGNAVKLRGVAIGRVDEITVTDDGQAVQIAMSVDADMALPDDPVVVLSPESMFGDWQAQITSRSAFPRYDFTEAPQPEVLPGYTLPDISQLTATADEIAGNLRTLTERVDMAFTEETARNIAQAIDNIQNVSQRLGQLVGQQAETFENLADRVEQSADELGGAARSVRTAFTRMDTLLTRGEVEDMLVDGQEAVSNLRRLTQNLAGSTENLDATLAEADSTFARLNEITATIESGEGTLGRLLYDSTLVTRTEQTLQELNLLLEDFRENPNRYVRLSIF